MFFELRFLLMSVLCKIDAQGQLLTLFEFYLASCQAFAICKIYQETGKQEVTLSVTKTE